MMKFIGGLLGCTFGHRNIEKTMTESVEFSRYSPMNGTKVIKARYVCKDCGRDLTDVIEMQRYYRREQQEFEMYQKAQAGLLTASDYNKLVSICKEDF